jgi:type I restriction enzyme S subunit
MTGDIRPTIYGNVAGDFVDDRLANLCEADDGVQTGPFGCQLHQEDYVAVGTPIITVEHLGENRIIHDGVPRVSDDDKTRLSKYTLHMGDIVFSRVGSVDRRALVRNDEDGWLFSGRCLRVRPDPTKIDSGYLSFFFGLPSFKEHIRAIAVGATMPSLNTQLLSNVVVPHPPSVDEQRAIAHVLGTLDDKIELNRRVNETLEAMARALFKSWFVDFDPVRAKAEGRDPGLPKHLADMFPDSFEESELGEIPKGWRIVRVAELADINARTLGRLDPLDVVDYIEISEVMRGEIREVVRYARGTEPSRARRRLAHGDTVLSSVRPDRGAHFLCLDPPETLIASTGFVVLSPRKGNWAFLYSALTRPEVGQDLGRLADGGAYPALRPEAIGELRLAEPNASEVVSVFEKLTQPLFERAAKNRHASRALAEVRDALLPRLISGEIRVKA